MKQNLLFSIDLDAELAKITQRQYLNRVHYLVQLVRHALIHNPHKIRVASHKQWIELIHDGHPLQGDERDLITKLLDRGEASWETRQRYLTRLEENHGITMLSLIHNAERARLVSGNTVLESERGRLWVKPVANAENGYRLKIYRDQATPKDELEELLFYAAGADVPIEFNGKTINKPIEFTDQIMVTRFKNEKGYGAVGLPAEGDLCVFTYFKNGVRLGYRRFLPKDGRVFHGFWNAVNHSYEANYAHTIQAGVRYLQDYANVLFKEVGPNFERLSETQKERTQKILCGLRDSDWEAAFGHIPMFHGCHQPFALSLSDLRLLEGQFGFLPFRTKPTREVPANIPRLSPEEVCFLRDALDLKVKLLKTRRGKRQQLKMGGKHFLDPASLDDSYRDLLEILNASDLFYRFHITDQPSHGYTDQKGRANLCLFYKDPLVLETLQTIKGNKNLTFLTKYRLMTLATPH